MEKISKKDKKAIVASILASIIYGPGIEHAKIEGDEEAVKKGEEAAVEFAVGLVK